MHMSDVNGNVMVCWLELVTVVTLIPIHVCADIRITWYLWLNQNARIFKK